MAPTKVYGAVPELLESLPERSIHALANITGGGISGNLPRVLPEGVVAKIEEKLVPVPDWMMSFCEDHGASFLEVEKVYNMGAGMIAAVDQNAVEQLLPLATKLGLEPKVIGKIENGQGPATVQYC